MIIDKVEIAPGENKTIKLNVGHLPTGGIMDLQVMVFRSKKPGPTVLLLGGLHGDEINGVEIIRRGLRSKMFTQLNKGTVIVVPIVNVHGFINYERTLPDGKDINRSFPGSTRGSLASRVAGKLNQHILPLTDIGIDFHTGGRRLHNHPQVRVSDKDEKALELAQVFGAPFVVISSMISKSLRKESFLKGIPMLVYEGGESLRLDQISIEQGVQGTERILSYLGMVDANFSKRTSVCLRRNRWIRASQSGIFVPIKVAGDKVKAGEVIGSVSSPYGDKYSEVKTKEDGYIYGHNNMPVINIGEPLFHIGYISE
jgi:predicted deacylase